MTTYQVIVDYDETAPLDEQPVAWSHETDGYEGWGVFPDEYRHRPTDIKAAVALVVDGEIIGVQRSKEADDLRIAQAAVLAAEAAIAAQEG